MPEHPEDNFYEKNRKPQYLETVVPLFQLAKPEVKDIQDILAMGIYITNVVKLPKKKSAVEYGEIENSLPILEQELSLFPNLVAIGLMGDVAKKAFNRISKKKTGRNAIPQGATYRQRHEEFYWESIRMVPSYVKATAP